MNIKKSIMKLGLAAGLIATPVVSVFATVSCGVGVKKADLTVMFDQQEMALYAPRIKAFEDATGLVVKMIPQDAQTVATDLAANKMSHTLPDILLSGTPESMVKKGYAGTLTYREIFSNDTFINEDLSESKFQKSTDLEFYNQLISKYDKNVLLADAEITKVPTTEKEATAFLDKKVNGLATGSTGWGMWIRENQLKGYDANATKFAAQAEPITKYLLAEKKPAAIPMPDYKTVTKPFLDSYLDRMNAGKTGDDVLKISDIFYEPGVEATTKASTTFKDLAKDFDINKTGAFKGTSKGIEAFVATSQMKSFDNPNYAKDGWYSVGFTGQFQRENAAIYSAKTEKSKALWDGYFHNGVLGERFDAKGAAIDWADDIVYPNGKWKNAGLEKEFEALPADADVNTTKDSFAKRWYFADMAYQGTSVDTNEQTNKTNDPATGFWFPQASKNLNNLPVALVKGQQWQGWPLNAKLNEEKQKKSVESIKTIAIPFKTPGQAAYSISSQVISSTDSKHKSDVYKLFRMLFSEESLKPLAGKLQSTMINQAGVSISKDITNADPENKAYLARGLFDNVFLLGAKNGDKTYTTDDIYSHYSKYQSYDVAKENNAKYEMDDIVTPATEYIRKIKDDGSLNNWKSWVETYRDFQEELGHKVKNANS